MHCCVHVDDIGYTGTEKQANEFEKEIVVDFKIDLLGRLGQDPTAKRYLGMQIDRFPDRFEIHNQDLIDTLLRGRQAPLDDRLDHVFRR